eukprot:TRINITY_DN2807_c0_g1_i2.p2 TRINITY_DN2807_c0_g1~~TRINITY_DN2807_c0_g1_i2.p2  ORF type:complete len:155 (-),score=23.71 TRINITY_DN2807_c0_g1_i2:56-520(-)
MRPPSLQNCSSSSVHPLSLLLECSWYRSRLKNPSLSWEQLKNKISEVFRGLKLLERKDRIAARTTLAEKYNVSNAEMCAWHEMAIKGEIPVPQSKRRLPPAKDDSWESSTDALSISCGQPTKETTTSSNKLKRPADQMKQQGNLRSAFPKPAAW